MMVVWLADTRYSCKKVNGITIIFKEKKHSDCLKYQQDLTLIGCQKKQPINCKHLQYFYYNFNLGLKIPIKQYLILIG